ncbi:MAG: hypothetical protein A3H33_11430 [Betaproteobacteria bacterium RIFCSPLOWO2_02_FULL_65_20]|nr:MAG: hypothetical protein A3H33_11430 [Betaproteobacteria bacterium RIFCSPLOWO2_02_FULL_65_20]
MAERALTDVPKLVLAMLAGALALQIGLKLAHPVVPPAASDLRPPPSQSSLRLASLGDPIPLAKLLMLYLQSFDYQAVNRIPFRDLNYDTVQQWLLRVLWLDPRGQYPLLAASRLYADVPDEPKTRLMLEFVYRQFLDDPDRRWPWLAHAAAVAKHRLKDLPLARRYAAAIQQHAGGPDVPLWAKQMEVFILEDMDELETARIMIGGFLSSGTVRDPAEIRFLDQRLRDIEARLKSKR